MTVGDRARFDSVAEVIRARRTSMKVDPSRDVDDAILGELFELASWAPCHKRTWPWEFCVVRGDSRLDLGQVVSDAMQRNGDDAQRVDKARTKYARTPVIVVVGSAPGDSPNRTAENRDATAAALQNFMLGASALGVATYWGSCPKGANDDVARFCGFTAGAHVMSLTYVGWASEEVVAPERPAPNVTRRD
ncbi:MAG: nitroreductase family protein [Ilumatobacteraceae bacterium]